VFCDESLVIEMNALVERLKGHWLEKRIRIQAGASLDQVKSFESHYQVCLPQDLRDYFTTVNGMEKGEIDEELFSFLPLQAVKSIPEELGQFGGIPDYTQITRSLPDARRWFVIVDYLICSAVYAIRLSAELESTPVMWIGDGTHYREVAPCFSGFLESYMTNPRDLF